MKLNKETKLKHILENHKSILPFLLYPYQLLKSQSSHRIVWLTSQRQTSIKSVIKVEPDLKKTLYLQK